MSERITKKRLEAIVNRINEMTKSPIEPYTKLKSGKFRANIGCYHLSYAYGGVELERMHSSGGGTEDVLGVGYVSKPELDRLLFAFMAGITNKENRK